ncbi:metallophosphoesterase family protein [Alkalicoccus daliensis]|uniref:DNA repair exonuclease SbcCD nuclease subunit n=1 Tax=Alkalicoccus daliensis TaxID=745820 RepID=A0A1H0IEI8_9BACI|nr:DNA repair exonuclease [Alkalicoccus daliensis]SDO29899.1 DNA repair exonuclease SbcCD nuclease subunit [Alkalicoccus daliensis]
MVSFIHCADLHLDRPFQLPEKLHKDIELKLLRAAYSSFEKLCTKAIEYNVDFMLISGDLYHHEKRSVHAQWFVKKQMERLNKEGIQVYLIHGNHDPLLQSSALVPLPENVRVFSVTGETFIHETGNEKVCLYGFSYPSASFSETPMPMYRKTESADTHIALLHGQEAAETEHEPYAPFRLQELKVADMDYWALGHIHERKELSLDPPIVYPGNIQGCNRKENGPKGGYFVKLAGSRVDELTFLPTSDVEWRRAAVSITEINTLEELFEEVFHKCINEGKYCVYTVELSGSGPLHAPLHQRKAEIENWIKEEAEGIHLSIESLQLYTKPELEQIDSELGKEIEAAAASLGSDPEELMRRLSSLMGHPAIQRHMEPMQQTDLADIVEEARVELLLAMQEEEE